MAFLAKPTRGIIRIVIVLSLLAGFLSIYLYRASESTQAKLEVLKGPQASSMAYLPEERERRAEKIVQLESKLSILSPFNDLCELYKKMRISYGSLSEKLEALDGSHKVVRWMDISNFLIGALCIWFFFGILLFIRAGYEKK